MNPAAFGQMSGADDPLIWYDSQGRRRSLITDQQGSVIALSDVNVSTDPLLNNTPSSNPLAVNTYDEYGIPGAGNQGRFQGRQGPWRTHNPRLTCRIL
jgi:hypothetical protein